jgi:hypothetical protein
MQPKERLKQLLQAQMVKSYWTRVFRLTTHLFERRQTKADTAKVEEVDKVQVDVEEAEVQMLKMRIWIEHQHV